MTRSKVKLELITNESARRATFKKRKKGLLKKIEELSTLCGVDACAIIYGLYEDKPDVWPNLTGVRCVLSRFMSLPEEDQEKKMLDQEAYLRQRLTKLRQQLEKMRRELRDLEMAELLYECLDGKKSVDGLDVRDNKDLSRVGDKFMDVIAKRIDDIEKPAVDIDLNVNLIASSSSEGDSSA